MYKLAMWTAVAVTGFLLFQGCHSDPFPVGEEQNAGFQVPLVPTYTFNFRTGTGEIFGTQGNLRIVSGADIQNLVTATPGAVAQEPDLGVLSGIVTDRFGRALPSVSIGTTDASGNIIRNPDGSVKAGVTDANGQIISNILYNSINGVPEFINTTGTSPSGSFTGLNVPPGQHFVKAVQGGRGNGRVNIFAGGVSLLDMAVFPVALPTANVAGAVRERDELTPVPQSVITFPGLGGGITTNNAGAFSASGFGSESLFLARVRASAHIDTYQQIFTDLADLTVNAVVPEITKNFTSISTQDVQQLVSSAGSALIPGQGIILGKVVEAGGRKTGAILSATNAAGTPVGEIYYFPAGSDFPVCNTPATPGCQTQTSTNGNFLILNLPPGDVYLKAHAIEDASGSGEKVKSTGSALAAVFPDGLTRADITTEVTLRVDPAAPASPPPPTWYTINLSGTVVNEDGQTPVGDAQIRALGLSDMLPNSDTTTGTYNIATGADPNAVSPLLANSTYLMRLDKAGHTTTYQTLTTGGQDLIADLTLVSGGLIGPTNGTGAILGRVINRRLGGRVNEVKILTTQMANQNNQLIETGDAVGTIHYFGNSGVLDTSLTETTDNGLFLIRNVPPGLIMIKTASSDDSGNAILRVFPDGVTKVDIILNHVPINVPVQGSLSDLHDNPVSGATLSLLGEQSVFTSESLAAAPGVSVPANGTFLTRVQKSGFIDTVNDQLETGLNAQSGEKFFVSSISELSQFATQGGLTLDLTKGIIAGEIVEQSISDTAVPVSTGTSPTDVATGFFNEDIFPDLAVTHGPDQIQIFLGQASGVFIPATPPSILVGNDPAGIGVGDFNRDGLADLVVSNRGSGTISRLMGVGDGKFSTIAPITQGIGTAPGPIAVADLNQDERLDLVIANTGSDDLSILIGDGSGSFSVNTTICPTPLCKVAGPPTDIATGDFNGDAILDLAVATNTGTVSLFWSGQGSINTELAAGTNPSAIATADFNGDGHLDLAVANAGSDDLSVFKGDGNERFDKVDCLPGPDPATDPIAENCPLSPGGAPGAMLTVDFEQDGDQDLVIANTATGTLSVAPGKGDGRFDPPSKTFTVGAAPKGVVLSDLNQDGREDLVALNTGEDTFSILLSQKSPVAGAVIGPRDLEGNPVGTVRYMNTALDVDPALTQTSSSGRFIVFDLPFGLITLKGRRATAPGVTALTGNGLVNITDLGSLFYTRLKVDIGLPGSVTSVGVTCRPVGVACTKIAKSDISFLGSTAAEFCPPGPDCLSDATDARYNVLLDPNSTYVVRIIGPNAILPGDTDGDSVPDQTDNCPNVPNPDQVDANGNQIGDTCELSILDSDGDELNDDIDNCPFVPNFGQEDDDRDGIGNACDGTPNGKPAASEP
ncbi:MAG: FG-GAP-like repeat-containing protein [Nitrospiria bacterium]